MVTYVYECHEDGAFEVRRAMGAAEGLVHCASCGEAARRVFLPPLLARTPVALSAALHRDEASADSPRVVATPPPRPGVRRPPSRAGLPPLPRP